MKYPSMPEREKRLRIPGLSGGLRESGKHKDNELARCATSGGRMRGCAPDGNPGPRGRRCRMRGAPLTTAGRIA